MTLVERAIEKMRRTAAAKDGGALAAVGSLVQDRPAGTPEGSPSATPPARRIHIDSVALRDAGYLPESSRDRQFAGHYRLIKRPLIARAQAAVAGPTIASPRLIMMASALPGDGKTFTSINLALSMARERDISVLLVDADVPKPHVSRIFGVEREPGLLDALLDSNMDVESLVLPTDIGSLSILPAGNSHEGATELIASARMAAIVTRLISQNPRRVVLFDTPPLLVSSESRALAAIAGQVVMVVRAGSTPQNAVLDAIELVGENKEVSLILNEGRVGLTGGYYGYGEYGSYDGADSPADEGR